MKPKLEREFIKMVKIGGGIFCGLFLLISGLYWLPGGKSMRGDIIFSGLVPLEWARNTIPPTETLARTPENIVFSVPEKGTPTSTPFLPDAPTPTYLPTPLPTVTPTPLPPLPASAQIYGMRGSSQAFALSCEANAATIWAAYFGVTISESEFQSRLPLSDNPNRGFVGSVHGYWGQIPPAPYGVYAKPVARMLRQYGLNAQAVKGMSYQDLRREIAQGKPVIVWVIGQVWNGHGIVYYDSQGRQVVVAPFEHTVIVTGYSPTSVTILDGNWTYQRTVESFKQSWGVLGNMAVIMGE